MLLLKIFYLFRTPANSRLLHREVVRLVTPGTLLEPLKPDANYLMSIVRGPDSSLGLAWLDVSTGEFHLGVSSLETLEEDLSRVNPAEVGVILAMGVNAFLPTFTPRRTQNETNKRNPQYYIIFLITKIQMIPDIRLPDLVEKLELNGCT